MILILSLVIIYSLTSYFGKTISLRWSLIGKIFIFSVFTSSLGIFTFIIAACFSDEHNDGLVLLTLIIAFSIWVVVSFRIFRSHNNVSSAPGKNTNRFSILSLLFGRPTAAISDQIGGSESSLSTSSGANVSPDTPLSSSQIQELTLNEKVEFIDIGNKSGVIFTFHDKTRIKIQLKNLAKIAYELIRDFRKNQFFPGELSNHFVYLRDTYRSTLPPEQYGKLMQILERFVSEGGSMEVV